ncbi:hypothetical protein OROHE_025845 [Orobanche hederae]
MSWHPVMSSVFELVIKERLSILKNSIPMDSGMNLLKKIIVFGLFITVICGSCKASIYKVGDEAGWDIMGDVVYNQWALSKIFKVGDTIGGEFKNVILLYYSSSKLLTHPHDSIEDELREDELREDPTFEYDPEFHSVLQVSQSDFHSCNTATPIYSYTTGNDSIAINNSGHYYYICGVMGHCEAGQKVDIIVTDSRKPAIEPVSSPANAPSQTVVPKTLSGSSVTPSSGESLVFNIGLFSSNVGLLLILLCAAI